MPELLSACPLCSSSEIPSIDPSIALCKCTECGFVFRNPRPTVAEIVEYYSNDSQYASWLSEETARDGMWRRRLQKIKRHCNGGSLLDVGAGIGQFLYLARDTFDVDGTEVSLTAVRLAREKYGIALHHGTVEELINGALNGRRFDVITLFHVLEHVSNPSELLQMCKNLLRKRGLIVIAVPNELYRWNRPIRWVLKVMRIARFRNIGRFSLPKINLEEPSKEIHLSHFTCDTLVMLLKRHGFSVRELSLDPFYAASGLALAFHHAIYAACAVLFKISGLHIYDAIWAVAEKTD